MHFLNNWDKKTIILFLKCGIKVSLLFNILGNKRSIQKNKFYVVEWLNDDTMNFVIVLKLFSRNILFSNKHFHAYPLSSCKDN